jgi:hypothetical protein
MSKRARDLDKDLERIGYAYDRTNTKGIEFFIHEGTGCEIKVPSGVNESTCRSILVVAQRQIGMSTKDNKRNSGAIRERNAREHALAAAALARVRAQRNEPNVSETRMRELEEAYRRADRKFKYWDRLMRGVSA